MSSSAATIQMAIFEQSGMTEKVIYRPLSRRPREIVVVVDRIDKREFMDNAATPRMRLTILCDAIAGIKPNLINTGGDRIDVAERFGGDRTARSIMRIIEQDGDFATIEVA